MGAPASEVCSLSDRLAGEDLFADAEVAEDDVEEVFDVDGTGDAAEAAQRETEIFRSELGERRVERAAQRGGSFFERLAVACARQHWRLGAVALRDLLAEGC